MHTPLNTFKQAMQAGEQKIGLWVGLADGYVAEILAGTGYDWLLLDGEHAPNDVRSVLAQLQGISSAWSAQPELERSHPVVRVPVGDTTLLKQYLDIGAQTILVPMVETAEQAATLVQSMLYPPQGVRGVGGARASRWGRIPNYLKEANDQACLLVQVETALALKNLDAIAATEGVDGVFIGPSDLSASLGHIGNPGHPEVQDAIADAIARIRKAGKAPGILTPDETLAKKYLELGAVFVSVGVDTNLLVRHTTSLLSRFKDTVAALPPSKTY